jgi:general secretion pathway protein D
MKKVLFSQRSNFIASSLVWFSLAFMILAGCASGPVLKVPSARLAIESGQTIDRDAEDASSAASESNVLPTSDSEQTREQVERIDAIPRVELPKSGPVFGARFSDRDSVSVVVESMTVKDFVSYVFKDLLKADFVIADGSPGLDSTVSLSAQQSLSSRKLFKLTGELLAQRQLAITEKEGMFFIGPATGKSNDNFPLGFGSRPVDVPDVPGKILQVIPLKYASVQSIARAAGQFLEVGINEDPQQSAIFVTGTRSAILKVLDIVKLLDQPSVKASRLGILNLTYVGSREFVDQAVTLLENEGIPTGVGRADGKSVALVPLDQLGGVAVFAINSALLDRVEFWAKQIDRPSQGPTKRYFVYQPRYARAADIGQSLQPLLGFAVPQITNSSRDTRSAFGGSAAVAPTGSNADSSPQRPPRSDNASQVVSVQTEELTMTVDPRSNSIVFFATGPKYEALLPMIRRLDVPPKQILLEATVAEVSLTGDFAYGVEYAFSKTSSSPSDLTATSSRAAPMLFNGDPSTFSGSTALGLPSGGLQLNFVSNVTDQIRLKLAANDGQVRVLATPVLVVRDGVSAQISVGNDVPTIGATVSDPVQSNRQITTVSYRKTGLDLEIVPTINAQGSVLMEISQRISNAVPGSSGVNGAPTFFERSVKTEVVAQSGAGVLLAGLISESGSATSSKIPGLGSIPGLGALFRSDSKKTEKTELVLLITPKIIESPAEWQRVWETTRGFFEEISLERLELPQLDSKP